MGLPHDCRRDEGLCPLAFQRLPEPAGPITAAGQQPVRRGPAARQGRRICVVVDLACGYRPAGRLPEIQDGSGPGRGSLMQRGKVADCAVILLTRSHDVTICDVVLFPNTVDL